MEDDRPYEEDDAYEDNDIFNEDDEDTDEWAPQKTPKRKSQIAKKKTSSLAGVSKVVTLFFEDCAVGILHSSNHSSRLYQVARGEHLTRMVK